MAPLPDHRHPRMPSGFERRSGFVPVVPDYVTRLPPKSTNQGIVRPELLTQTAIQHQLSLPHLLNVQRLASSASNVEDKNLLTKQENKQAVSDQPTYFPASPLFNSFPNSVNSSTSFMVSDYLYESAARLLFMTVKWARGIPAFLTLPFSDQAILLEESWSELFVLGACQWSLSIGCGQLFGTETLNSLKTDQSEASIKHDVRLLQDTVYRVRELQVDPMEFACLKALTLFRPDSRGLREVATVERLQDDTQLTLAEYNRSQYMAQRARFGKLLLLLPSVRNVKSKTLETLYFRSTIGSIPIERLLCDMFKSC